MRERERRGGEGDWQTGRQIEIQTDRQTAREIEGGRERGREGGREGGRKRAGERQAERVLKRERERGSHRQSLLFVRDEARELEELQKRLQSVLDCFKCLALVS